MTSTFSATALPVGSTISLIINGLLSIKRCFNVNESFQRQDQDQQEDASLQTHPLREYNVTLSSGGTVETIYILARNSMQAAYSALELAGDRNSQLINVQITDEW
jgi:hypothetical protein